MRPSDASQLEVGALFFSVGMAGVYGTAVAHAAAPGGTPWWGLWADAVAVAAILAAVGVYIIASVYFPKRLPLPPTYATPRVRIRGWEVVPGLTGNGVVTVRCDVDNYGHVDVPNVSLNFLVPRDTRPSQVYRSTQAGSSVDPKRQPSHGDESLKRDAVGNPVLSWNWNEELPRLARGITQLFFRVEGPPGDLPVFLRLWAESLDDVDSRQTFQIPPGAPG